jgi:hypothetical protein
MNRIQSLFAALVVAATVAAVPAANAQCANATSAHFVGAGSSAQWQMAALGADQVAINENNTLYSGLGYTVQHWTIKNLAYVQDTRDSRINPEVGNLWVVWIQDGAGDVCDLWEAISVDSTVGVRTFSAQETSGSGGQVYLSNTVTTSTAGAKAIQEALWNDGTGIDTPLTTAVINLIGEGPAINPPATAGLHVNVGMTDIRPEDALFATTRALAKLNTTTWAGLGYVGVSANIGAPILTNQGTGTEATPIKFALAGASDPITHTAVPAYTTVPIGAAPIVFIVSNGGTPAITNLVTGVIGDTKSSGPYYASEFFGGKVACDTHAAAFGGSGDGAGTPLTVILREPLSGTMNTTEFTTFRTFGNPDGSQETGVINPLNAPYNPLNLSCPTHGKRSRAIGTGEVVNAVLAGTGSAPVLGYIFYGFSNASKLSPSSNYNYLTVDGVDPIGLATTNQQLSGCGTSTQPNCPANLWLNSNSYPNLRNGTYKAWSVYRWLIANSNIGSDPYGFDVVAQTAQDYVDSQVADFVPFLSCPSGDTNPVCTGSNLDGLDVYRSHFTQSGKAGNNGSATAVNSFDGGNTLGGGTEAGGDVGGLIEGPFGTTVSTRTGTVTTVATLTKNKGYKVTWKTGINFTGIAAGDSITINGTANTVETLDSSTIVYVTNNPGTNSTAVPYSAPVPYTYPSAATPGVLNKKE